jgi:hypothetical protein
MSDYNGWTNYETWVVNLWLDNEEGSQRFCNEMAMEALDDSEGDVDRASPAMARTLRDHLEEGMPELAGLWQDLLRSAFDSVNWDEIARSWVGNNIDEWREQNLWEESNPQADSLREDD